MMAGLFASFSTFMMKALGSLERSEGVRYAGDQSPNCAAQFPAGLYGHGGVYVVSAYVAYGDVGHGATLASLLGCMWSDVYYRRSCLMFR